MFCVACRDTKTSANLQAISMEPSAAGVDDRRYVRIPLQQDGRKEKKT